MDSYTLKSVSDLPLPFHSIFSFRYFNSLQSECFPVCFHSDANMVISAPTGSGKTVLFELCILRLLSRFVSEGILSPVKGTLKTIYIAPSKALVQEKLRDWSQKFGSLGMRCLELTGDNEFYNIRTIQEADIILTTPEKFDAVSRYRLTDGGLSFFSDIGLLLIDEVHLLNDPRGAALEAIVSRIKMLSCKPEMKSSPLSSVRFLAVSATIPNIDDLAEWLKVPTQGIKRFGEEMRPVKLTTKVFGYAPVRNDYLFEKRLQNYIFDILMLYSRGKSALVFCSTRKGAQEAAQQLSHMAMTFRYSNPFVKNKEQQERLREASLTCTDKQMQSYILYGVGYHNGGLCLKDRNLIEGLFLKGDIQILCTTNTLAHGINLPAHTVVIKSTQYFNKEKGLYTEYDRSTLLQMCGRAGRPPFDDTGMVVIMTRRETVHLYENMLNGCEMVESQLLSSVTEHLTAEIVQLTVPDIARAIEWMKCSYLYVRMKKNPENYAIRKGISKDRIEMHVQEISVQKVHELSNHQMIWTDEDGFLLRPLEPGRLMTRYYLKFDTMKHIMKTPENCTLEDALNVVCHAEEISCKLICLVVHARFLKQRSPTELMRLVAKNEGIQLRRNEKKLLNDINADKDGRLRFHINGDKGKRKKRIQTREEKIFVLTNDCLTGDPSVRDLSLTQDMNSICSNGCRIAKCMKEYFTFRKNYRGAVNSNLLAKSLYQKLWDDSPYLLKQLSGIGMVTAKALISMGIKSFDALAEADPRRIEIITGRKFPFGNHIKESLLSLPPKVNMIVEETDCHRRGKSKVIVTLTRLSESFQSVKRHYADMIVGTEEDNLIHFHERIRVDEFSSPYSATILLSVPQQQNLTVKADLIFEEYIGLDCHKKLVLSKDRSSDTSRKHEYKRPCYIPPPEEAFIINDADDAASFAPFEKLCNLTTNDPENSSMPSFNLIDEELGEDAVGTEIKKDTDKILSEKTIFDHIREKAKSFPGISISTNGSSPSSKAFLLTKKRPREEDVDHELDAIEQIEASIILPQVKPNMGGPRQEGQNGLEIKRPLKPKRHINADSSITMNFVNVSDGLPSEICQDMHQILNKDTIFDHIRRKAENFPVLSRTTESDSPFWSKKQLSQNRPELCSAAFETLEEGLYDKATRDATFIWDLEAGGKVNDIRRTEALTKVKNVLSSPGPRGNVTPTFSRMNSGPSSVEMLSFDISTMKNNMCLAESGSSMEGCRKQQSPSGSKKKCCSVVMAGETREVDSFLAFKSVFSFL